MKCLVILVSYFLGLSTVQSLVHYVKLEATGNGCKLKGAELEVGAIKKDPNVCGVYVCQNLEGDALIHYCQKPATFAECPKGSTGVSTVIPFPQCCWTCVEWKDCGKLPSPSTAEPSPGGGDESTDGDGESTENPESTEEPGEDGTTDEPTDGESTEPPDSTEAPEGGETEAPETEAPETEAPETEAPETGAPETEAPETEAPAKRR